MSGRYAPLPNPAHDPDVELEGAFASSDDESEPARGSSRSRNESNGGFESVPLMSQHSPVPAPVPGGSAPPGTYDFEAVDWIVPPPGSPPAPSAFARENDIGNSNGVTGTSAVRPAPVAPPRRTFLRRVAGALLPQHYARVPTEDDAGRRAAVGGGMSGVFANVVAKPTRPIEIRNADGSIVHVAPETTQREAPPSYATAQLDSVPPYWDSTATISADPYAEMMIEDLPVGTFIVFACNIFISFFFQFVGFLMTYLMHTTHAAKYGSRVGLGLTMIQYGYFSRRAQIEGMEGVGEEVESYMTNSTAPWPPANGTLPDGTDAETALAYSNWLASREWIAFIFMALGWFIVLTSCVGFFRVKRYERSLRASIAPPPSSSPTPASPTAEQIARANAAQRAIARAFGFEFHEPGVAAARPTPPPRPQREPTPEERAAEERLRRDLEAAGFI